MLEVRMHHCVESLEAILHDKRFRSYIKDYKHWAGFTRSWYGVYFEDERMYNMFLLAYGQYLLND